MTMWLTLSNLPLYQWRDRSLFYRLFRGSLQSWRQSSWLLQWGETLGFILIALVFSLAPFVNNTLIGLLLIACAIFWGILTVSDPLITNFTPIHLLVLLYWGIATIATALSVVKMQALVGWSRLTLYLAFFAFVARIFKIPRWRAWIITIYLHVSLIVSVYGIRQWIAKVPPLATWNDPTSAQANATRVYSYLGNPNLLGGYLLPAIALSLAALLVWRSWWKKTLALTMLIVNTACLFYTGSRGATIGLVVLMLTFLVFLWYWWSIYLPPMLKKWSLPVILGGFVTVFLLGMLLVESLRDRVLSIFAGRQDSSNNFRINVWNSVINMIKDYPVLGIGPGNVAFNKMYPIYMKSRFTALSAYSIFLEVAVETGIIGLICFLWLLFVTLNQGFQEVRKRREVNTHLLLERGVMPTSFRVTIPLIWQDFQYPLSADGYWLIAAIATLLGMMGQGLFDTVLYRPEINLLWWLMVAIIASYYQPLYANEE